MAETSSKLTHPKKRAFLAAYSETGNVVKSCAAVGIERRTHYNWRREDPVYAKLVEEAFAEFADHLEAEAIRRAYEGVDEPITVAGEKTIVRKYDTTLLIFLLKRAKPEQYRERFDTRHSGADGRPLFPLESIRQYMEQSTD